MKKENIGSSKAAELPGRLTRARAAAFRANGQLPPLREPTQQNHKPLRANPKRAASDQTCPQRKKRAVLQDVTNVFCENSYRNCFNATKIQAKKSKLTKTGQVNISREVPSVSGKLPQLQVDSQPKSLPETGLVSEDANATCSSNLGDNALHQTSGDKVCRTNDGLLGGQTPGLFPQPLISQTKAKRISLSELPSASKNEDYLDIDADHEDPQLCSDYAVDIYNNLRVLELARRPSTNFMETVQRDITQSMRGILVDWLVEVSEEYKLVPDTLYLTIYLIDWFLSKNYIERQRLQLLGITCMLISSKLEEICPPRIEEFCFITDNTYTKEEVLKMETQVFRCSQFQMFAPTTKTFLRRFLRAAQASYKCPSLELEYLANYLAELSLMDYSFLTFLPSLVAASVVFLARWTLDQSYHPWNPTLEHYSRYKASDLKATIVALQDLQLNTKGCPLSAIRMKYRQDKFKNVAAMSSPKLRETLF
ncbi:cyclin-A2-4 [Neltuma alba]|uniref:cyclin-A2-4 n=1 Tax=Neltuma alba TaxID=207710 RepID=UPI0010A4FE18|nr:cyclin-A2-4 [Prosopis alba]XP_028756113.1 cyclin-A2-4 [Prosopis alba]XP_028756114.1 cyclin-A2-4 [Prosopis alba]